MLMKKRKIRINYEKKNAWLVGYAHAKEGKTLTKKERHYVTKRWLKKYAEGYQHYIKQKYRYKILYKFHLCKVKLTNLLKGL